MIDWALAVKCEIHQYPFYTRDLCTAWIISLPVVLGAFPSMCLVCFSVVTSLVPFGVVRVGDGVLSGGTGGGGRG